MYGTKAVVKPLENEDLSSKWVVISAKGMTENFKPQFCNKENQVVKITGGFGAKGSALSLRGGKAFFNWKDGTSSWIHRQFILGIATPEVLKEQGIEE